MPNLGRVCSTADAQPGSAEGDGCPAGGWRHGGKQGGAGIYVAHPSQSNYAVVTVSPAT